MLHVAAEISIASPVLRHMKRWGREANRHQEDRQGVKESRQLPASGTF